MTPVRPFSGVRILDLTTTFAGSLATMHLADFGGDVLRMEAEEVAETPAHIVANRGKRLVDPSPASAVAALAARADVVVTDALPAVLEGSPMRAATLRRDSPRLIHVWMPPHAAKGALAGLPEDDLLLSAWSGMADLQPGALDQPVAPVVPVVAYEHGALGATATVAALLARQRTGSGRSVTVSGLHAASACTASTMIDVPGLVRPFSGEKSATWGPPNYRVYQCGDGSWVFLATLTAPFFLAALDAMDLLDVMVLPGVDGEFLNVFRPEVQPMVKARLAARFAERSGAAWREVLDAARVPNAPVQTREEWAASETVKAGGMLVRLPHRLVGEVVLPGPAVELAGSPGEAVGLLDRTSYVDPASIWPARDDEPPGTGDERCLPLDGLRVLDTSSFIAGPFTSTVLENFGATVVKVEQASGDPFGQVASATYAALNRGKGRVVLDLKVPADLAKFYGLAQGCDVMIENMSLGRVENLGIGIDDLARDNPGIVVCSVRAWGAGPLKDTPGFDPVLQARSGLMAAEGGEGAPVVLAVPVTDIGTGTLAAFGTLTALYARQALGRGQHVAASLARTSLAFQAAELTVYAQRPRPVVGDPAFLGDSDHHRLYRCEDGWIAIRATEPALHAFLVGEPSPSADPESAFRHRTMDEAVRALADAGIVAVPALDRNHLFGDPRLLENDFFFPVDDATLGPVTAVRSFADWEGVAPASSARTHGLGEDTATLVEKGWPVRRA